MFTGLKQTSKLRLVITFKKQKQFSCWTILPKKFQDRILIIETQIGTSLLRVFFLFALIISPASLFPSHM